MTTNMGTMPRGFGIPATPDLERARTIAAECENLGYSSIWSNDTPGGDGIATAHTMLAATKSLRVGVGVVAFDRRPAGEVTALLKSQNIPLDRFVLGVGAGGSNRPRRTVGQAIRTLRHEFGAELTLGVAAMGPRMCRLAGELADLVLLNWMLPERIRWADPLIASGEEERTEQTRVERAAYVRVALGEDVRLIGEEAARYNHFPAYRRHFAAMAAPLNEVGVAGDPDRILLALAGYDRVLDEVVVRALPTHDTIESTLAVAKAAAPRGAVH